MKIKIFGGGSAGWLTAVILKHNLPTYDIEIRCDDELATIGVGESTLPPFVECMNNIFKDENWLDACNGTIKTHIEHNNWATNNHKYTWYFPNNSVGAHVDNHLLVKLLKARAEAIGVSRTNNNNFENADLYIDCTGFTRFSNKFYNRNFIDFNHHKNNAWAGRILEYNSTKKYTTTYATKTGWIWEVPLNGYMGVGIVHNVEDRDEALAELKLQFPNLDNAKEVSFITGYFENPWVDDCIVIGNSAGFIEPLEATNMYFMQACAETLVKILPSFNSKLYNRWFSKMYNVTTKFIIAHYSFSLRSDWDYESNDDLLIFLTNGIKNNGYNTFIHSEGFKNFIDSYALD